jgi:hypothetical protein
MNAGERRLISLAAALAGDPARLSIAERELVACAHAVDPHIVANARRQILLPRMEDIDGYLD